MSADILPRGSARSELASLTRARIMTGVAKLIEAGAGELTFRELARASGVPERTLYRRFPTKDHLLREFWSWLNRERLALPPPAKSADELVARIPTMFAAFARSGALVRAMLRDPHGRSLRRSHAAARRTEVHAALRGALAGTSPAVQKKVAAAVRVLTSAAGWAALEDLVGLDAADAAAAAQWSVWALLAQAQSTASATRRRKRS